MKLQIQITTETLMDAALIEEAVANLRLKHCSLVIAGVQDEPTETKRRKRKRQMSPKTVMQLAKNHISRAKNLNGFQLRVYQGLIKILAGRPNGMERGLMTQAVVKDTGDKISYSSAASAVSTLFYKKHILEILP